MRYRISEKSKNFGLKFLLFLVTDDYCQIGANT